MCNVPPFPVKARSAGFMNFYRFQAWWVRMDPALGQKPHSRPSENTSTSTSAILWPANTQNDTTGYNVGPPSAMALHFATSHLFGFMVDISNWYSWRTTNKNWVGGRLCNILCNRRFLLCFGKISPSDYSRQPDTLW